MIRDLLYSICLHLFIALLLYNGSSVLYNKKPKNVLDLTNEALEINDDFLSKVKVKKSSKGINKLSLEEKVKLYKAIEKNGGKSNISRAKYKQIKERLKHIDVDAVLNKKIKSGVKTTTISNNVATQASASSEVIGNTASSVNTMAVANNQQNVLTKNSTKVYVNSKNLTKEEVKKIEKQNKVEKEIRETMGDKLPVATKKADDVKLDNLIKNLDQEVSIGSKIVENSGSNKVVNDNKSQAILKKDDDDISFEELNELMNMVESYDANEVFSKLDENEAMNLDLNDIFSQEDINKMQKIKNSNKSLFDLTTREKVNIQKQIKTCYKNAILKTKKNSKIVMSVGISVSRSGAINMNTVSYNLVDESNINNLDKRDYNNTIENIRLALISCNPLRNLPYQKYSIWRNMNLLFNNN